MSLIETDYCSDGDGSGATMDHPPHKTAASNTYLAIYAIVGRIPEGNVATYGQVAGLAGLPGRARLVGYALSALAGRSSLPWHRVVNAQGRISPRSCGSDANMEQRLRLKHEGVRFDTNDRIPLERFLWRPQLAGAAMVEQTERGFDPESESAVPRTDGDAWDCCHCGIIPASVRNAAIIR